MDSSRAQIRLQLLASDTGLPDQTEVNTMSGFAAHGRLQHPGMHLPMHYQNHNPNQNINMNQHPHPNMGPVPHPGGYSNHDLITPVLETSVHKSAGSSRKASMNSMSMQRLFRRKTPLGGNFDEDLGADLGDFSSVPMSFNDITHLRGAGRYNTSAAGNMDTAPIIPVLGGAGADPAKSLNNVEYRKYMNHQKKLNLAHSARAMSLAGGGNPVSGQDPRSMSFTNAQNSRTNSLGNSLNGTAAAGSRAMSLNSNAVFRGQPHVYGPNIHQQRPGQGGHNLGMQFAPHQGPHSQMPQQNNPYMGRSGPYNPMQGNGQTSPQFTHPGNNHTMSMRSGVPQNIRANPSGPRANSLSNNGIPLPHGQKSPSMTSAPGFPPVNQRSAGHANSNIPDHSPGLIHAPPTTDPSTDSLMNVLEEDEDEDKLKVASGTKSSQSSFMFSTPGGSSLPVSGPDSEDDHVYKFDDHDSPHISRKSTVTKSNSMRVRKLDLFNPKSKVSLDPGPPAENTETPAKLKRSTGLFGISNSVSPEDSDFSDLEPRISPSPKPIEDVETANLERTQKKPIIKLKSLKTNTAFNNLHSLVVKTKTETLENQSLTSFKLSDGHALPSSEVISDDKLFQDRPDQLSKDQSDSRSNFSNYSTETQNQTQTNPTQESLILDKSRSVDSVANDKSGLSRLEELVASEPGLSRLATQTSAVLVDSNSVKRLSFPSSVVNRMSSISRSNSELKLKGITPSSALLRADTLDDVAPTQEIEIGKREKRRSVSSISSKSRSLMKRLSLSSSRKTTEDADNNEDGFGKRKLSSAALQKSNRPLTFTKEELAIMTCNNELQSELQLVTSELAFSIKRELALESRLRSKSALHENPDSRKQPSSERNQSKVIADLQEKLNKERKLRFISEEHAILAEHGQAPSALKLDYEKNEIYNQLLAKNEMVIQLQDKLDEVLAEKKNNSGNDLALKFNELLKENSELKSKLDNMPAAPKSIVESDSHGMESESEGFYHEDDQALIMSLRTQRDELREMITKLTSSKNVELKIAQDKIKTLEAQLEKVNSINHKMSKRADKSAQANQTHRFPSGQGGKLQGFSIISSSKKFFDE